MIQLSMFVCPPFTLIYGGLIHRNRRAENHGGLTNQYLVDWITLLSSTVYNKPSVDFR